MEYIRIARDDEGAEVTQAPLDAADVDHGLFIPPTLVCNVNSCSKLVQEEIFGPVLTVQTFRSPAEAVKLANNTPYGLAGSVHSESIGLALEVAMQIRAGVIWVNLRRLEQQGAAPSTLSRSSPPRFSPLYR